MAFKLYIKLPFQVCGHTLTISLKNLDWRHTLQEELNLCSAKTIPLCQSSKDLQNLTRETKRQNLSQLSQLSFEELGGKDYLFYVLFCSLFGCIFKALDFLFTCIHNLCFIRMFVFFGNLQLLLIHMFRYFISMFFQYKL